MEDIGGMIAEAIAAYVKRSREAAAKRQTPPPLPPRPAAAGRVAPAAPGRAAPAPAAPARPAASPAKGIVDPRRRPAPPAVTIAPVTAAPTFDLPGVELLETAADPTRRARPSAHDARLGVLAALKAPGTLASGVVISEILAPPLSLRPPRTGP